MPCGRCVRALALKRGKLAVTNHRVHGLRLFGIRGKSSVFVVAVSRHERRADEVVTYFVYVYGRALFVAMNQKTAQ